jgi:hypothetical protein
MYDVQHDSTAAVTGARQDQRRAADVDAAFSKVRQSMIRFIQAITLFTLATLLTIYDVAAEPMQLVVNGQARTSEYNTSGDRTRLKLERSITSPSPAPHVSECFSHEL